MWPWEIVGGALSVLGGIGGAVTLFSQGRQRALVEQHEALEKSHQELSDRVAVLESMPTEIRAQSVQLSAISELLKGVQQDGKNNKDLLHTIIRGHMGDKS